MTYAKAFGLGTLTALLLVALAAAFGPSEATADDELADFTITVEHSEDTVRLTCEQGCAWTELSWSTAPDRPQAIDAYGMTGGSSE